MILGADLRRWISERYGLKLSRGWRPRESTNKLILLFMRELKMNGQSPYQMRRDPAG